MDLGRGRFSLYHFVTVGGAFIALLIFAPSSLAASATGHIRMTVLPQISMSQSKPDQIDIETHPHAAFNIITPDANYPDVADKNGASLIRFPTGDSGSLLITVVY